MITVHHVILQVSSPNNYKCLLLYTLDNAQDTPTPISLKCVLISKLDSIKPFYRRESNVLKNSFSVFHCST